MRTLPGKWKHGEGVVFGKSMLFFFIVGIGALAVDIGQVYGLCSRYCWVWGQFNIIGKLTFAKRQV